MTFYISNGNEINRNSEEMGEMYYDCPKCGHPERINNIGKMLLKTNPYAFKDITCNNCGHTFDAGACIKFGTIPEANITGPHQATGQPDASATPWRASNGDVVSFKRRWSKPEATYEEWTAPNAQAAKEYLNARVISERGYYVVIETPEGDWGKDIAGVYKE